jgi:hypothetical protein
MVAFPLPKICIKFSLVYATYPAHRILLALIILIISGEELQIMKLLIREIIL